jgi:hypothetical protein
LFNIEPLKKIVGGNGELASVTSLLLFKKTVFFRFFSPKSATDHQAAADGEPAPT